MLILSLIHKLVAVPWIYDLSQWLAGASKSRKVFREEFAALPATGCVLDVGGGTGLSRPLLPMGWKYFCLDPDPQKLEGFRAKFPDDEAVQASACEIPLDDESFDLCIMIAVSHHLTDKELRLALSEIRRLLRLGGKFMLMDAVCNPANLRGRFLWSLDRGSYPKTRDMLAGQLSEFFSTQSTRVWKVHHEYALFWCSKKDR
jgi:SAM-dependent methyltransferase